jgi:DNA-binding response OmpR family regulator
MLSSSLIALVIGPSQTQQWVSPVLVAAGFTLLTALDGIQAVGIASRHCPDLAIVDENTMRVGPTDLLAVLKRLTRVPVFVVGDGADEDVLSAVEQGADTYVNRSASPKEFLARTYALLRRHLILNVATRLTEVHWLERN